MIELLAVHPVYLVAAIFFARIADVSLGTLRTLLVFRSRPYLAAGVGFFEVLIWIVAAGQVLSDLSAWYLMVTYAAGFAAGNVVGIWLEAKMAIGTELVRVVSSKAHAHLADHLRQAGHSVIELEGIGDGGMPVEILFVVERRRRMARLLRHIELVDPDALCTISDIKRHTLLAMANVPRHRTNFRSLIRK